MTWKKPKHELLGQVFGALKVMCIWGRQNTNWAWVYYCRACGHIGKRLGTHLVTGRYVSCPACQANKPRRPQAPPPTKEELNLFFLGSPPPRTPESESNRDIQNWPTAKLRDLADRIQIELVRRGHEEVSAMDICSHCEGRLDRVGVHRVSDGQGGMRHSACPSTTEPR